MPHKTLAEMTPAEIVAIYGVVDTNAQNRRHALANRFAVESESHHDMLASRICEVYNSPAAKKEILKYVSKTLNVQRRVTDEVAAPLYRWAPSRSLEGASKTANRDWAKVLDEAGLKTGAKQWARYAFVGGLVFLFPIVREYDKKKRLSVQMILPDKAAVGWSHEDDVDPTKPSILIYKVDPYPVTRGGIPQQVDYLGIDADGWWGLTSSGMIVERRAVWKHGVPPFVCFRLTAPPPTDWWGANRGARLTEATLEAGRIQASMLWIRKEQQRKLLILKASSAEQVESGGSATPESSINLWGDPGEVDLQVLDYETKPDAFIDDIRYLVETALEGFGISASGVSMTSSASGKGAESDYSKLSLSVSYSLISLVRDDMIGYVEESERDLQYKIALQLDAGKHPLAKRFNPDKVRDQARVVFPPMTFADHPKARADIYKSKIELGLMTHAQALMEEFPGRWSSEEDAHEEVKRIVGARNEIAEMLAIHNTPKDPKDDDDAAKRAMSDDVGAKFPTKAQAFGAQGGRSKNQNRVDAREE